ncbi:MAG: hypothetical protein ABJE66_10245 [Deltaproteobacteria bacterium]
MVLLTACGGAARFRAEHVGTGIAVVSQRGAVVAAGAPIAVGQGAYDLRLHFDVPRAQLVEWAVACPGADSTGSVGEPFEAYRTRRLAQLKADRERDAQTAGAVTNALVGAFAPRVTATSESGPVRTDVSVSPGAAAGTAVAASIDQGSLDLPPGDHGAGPIETVVHVVTTAPGSCTVTAVADDPNVLGRFDLVHIRDLEAEAHARDAAIVMASAQARTAMTAVLVADGADVTKRQREREAAAHAEAEAGAAARAHAEAELEIENAHAEAELRVEHDHEAEVAAHAELELRARRSYEERQLRIAMEVRARWRMLLVSWGADVEYRARLRAEEEARVRAAAELDARRIRIAMEVRARWRLLLISWGADAEFQRHQIERANAEVAEHDRQVALLVAERQRREAMMLEITMRARTQLRGYLVAIGARERPPMPPMPPENPGAAPFAGATWVAGRWSWSGTVWEWSAGGWTDTSGGFGATGGDVAVQPVLVDSPVVETIVEAPVVVGPVPTVTTVIVPTGTVVRDHRSTISVTPAHEHHAPSSTPTVRDHRTSSPPPDKKVRDHR